MTHALDRLIVEAKSLAILGATSAALRHCASVEAARTPRLSRFVHGAAKMRVALALKLLMQAQDDFRCEAARAALLRGIGAASDALAREPDRAAAWGAPAPGAYWMKEAMRETA